MVPIHGWLCDSSLDMATEVCLRKKKDMATEVTCAACSTLDCSTFGNGHLLNGSNNDNGLVGSFFSKLG